MNLTPYEFEKAKDGDLFIKKGNKLIAIDFDYLAMHLQEQINDIANKTGKVDVVCNLLGEFKKLSYEHFINVFTLFELKAMRGEIENVNEELLNLDEKVLNGELSVEEALNKHNYLKETFAKLYGKEYDNLELLKGEKKNERLS